MKPTKLQKADVKKIACDFFRYWWNTPGNNTDQGFDEWWKINSNKYLGVAQEKEGRSEDDILAQYTFVDKGRILLTRTNAFKAMHEYTSQGKNVIREDE